MIFLRNPVSLALLSLVAGFASLCDSYPDTCVWPDPTNLCLSDLYPFCPNPECEPCCFCIPSGNGDCPQKKLEKLELNNASLLPTFVALHTMWDEDTSDIQFLVGCQPYEAVEALVEVGESQCEPYSSVHENTEVCAFVYDTSECKYSYKTFRSERQTQRLGSHAVITHEGHCGACSNAKDLAIYLDPSLAVRAYTCGMLGYEVGATKPFDEYEYNNFGAVKGCFEGIGFTPECAYVWASNAANSALPDENDAEPSCTDRCVEMFNDKLVPDPFPQEDIPNQFNDATCGLIDCINCDEERSGELFKTFAGRTRRNSGILTSSKIPGDPRPPENQYWYGLKRPCGDIAVIKQRIPEDFLRDCLAPLQ